MFFSFPAVVDQVQTSVLPFPGENSFGNAYSANPLILQHGPLSQLAYSGVVYASKPIQGVGDGVAPSILSLLTVYEGDFVNNTSTEAVKGVVRPPYNNQVHNTETKFVSNTYFEAYSVQPYPPYFVIPGNITSYYPDVFCTTYSTSQLPLYISRGTSFGLTNLEKVGYEQNSFAKVIERSGVMSANFVS